ncbi:hypothetical protein [Streptomyces chartreusis]|uniref:hypothetical protein n=1 Tax=Streptomyces chartreusis TaxID=1969 RepID=UPI00386D3AEF|nr:hypothetical protein OG938_44560 [Streptomyces chartreusis]
MAPGAVDEPAEQQLEPGEKEIQLASEQLQLMLEPETREDPALKDPYGPYEAGQIVTVEGHPDLWCLMAQAQNHGFWQAEPATLEGGPRKEFPLRKLAPWPATEGAEAWQLPVDATGREIRLRDLVVQDFYEQTHTRRVTRIYRNGSWLVTAVNDGDGTTLIDECNRMRVISPQEAAARVELHVEDCGYKGRIVQSIASNKRGQFRVLCTCGDDFAYWDEVVEAGHSRKTAWRKTLKEARKVWDDHCQQHIAATENIKLDGHRALIQQSQHTERGRWWVHCTCPGTDGTIISRPDGDSWCDSREEAHELWTWHRQGERGEIPNPRQQQPDVASTEVQAPPQEPAPAPHAAAAAAPAENRTRRGQGADHTETHAAPSGKPAALATKSVVLQSTAREFLSGGAPYSWDVVCGGAAGYSITHDCQGPGNKGVMFRVHWSTGEGLDLRVWALGNVKGREAAEAVVQEHWHASQSEDPATVADRMNHASGLWLLPEVGDNEIIERHEGGWWTITSAEGTTYRVQYAKPGRLPGGDLHPLQVWHGHTLVGEATQGYEKRWPQMLRILRQHSAALAASTHQEQPARDPAPGPILTNHRGPAEATSNRTPAQDVGTALAETDDGSTVPDSTPAQDVGTALAETDDGSTVPDSTTPTGPVIEDGANRYQAVRATKLQAWIVVDTKDHSIPWVATDTGVVECFLTEAGAESAANKAAHRLNTDPSLHAAPPYGATTRYTRPAHGYYLGSVGEQLAVFARIVSPGTPAETRGMRMAPRRVGKKARLEREQPAVAITAAGNVIQFWHQEDMPPLHAQQEFHVTGTVLRQKIVKNQKATVLASVSLEPADQRYDRVYLHQAAPTRQWTPVAPGDDLLLQVGRHVRIHDPESPYATEESDESAAFATVTLRERRPDGSWRSDAPDGRHLIITGSDVRAIEAVPGQAEAAPGPELHPVLAPGPTDVPEQRRQQLMKLRYPDLRDRWESRLDGGDEVLLITEPHTWHRVVKAKPYVFQLHDGRHRNYPQVIARRRNGHVTDVLEIPQQRASSADANYIATPPIGGPIAELDLGGITEELAHLDAWSTAASPHARTATVAEQLLLVDDRRRALAHAQENSHPPDNTPSDSPATRLPPIVDQQFATPNDLVDHLRNAKARPRIADRLAEERQAEFCRIMARREDAEHVLIPGADGRLAVVQVKPGNWQVRAPHRLHSLGTATRVNSRHHAEALADAMAEITDAAGALFPWSDPWADQRARLFRDARGRSLAEVLRQVRADVPEPPEPDDGFGHYDTTGALELHLSVEQGVPQQQADSSHEPQESPTEFTRQAAAGDQSLASPPSNAGGTAMALDNASSHRNDTPAGAAEGWTVPVGDLPVLGASIDASPGEPARPPAATSSAPLNDGPSAAHRVHEPAAEAWTTAADDIPILGSTKDPAHAPELGLHVEPQHPSPSTSIPPEASPAAAAHIPEGADRAAAHPDTAAPSSGPATRYADTELRPTRLLFAEGTPVLVHAPTADGDDTVATSAGAATPPWGTGQWQAVRYTDGTSAVIHPALISLPGHPRYPGIDRPSDVARWEALDRAEAAGVEHPELLPAHVDISDQLVIKRRASGKTHTGRHTITAIKLATRGRGRTARPGHEFTYRGQRDATKKAFYAETDAVTIAHPTTHPAMPAPADGRPITTRLLIQLYLDGPQRHHIEDISTLELIGAGQFALHRRDDGWELLPATTAETIWPDEPLGLEGDYPWPLATLPDAHQAQAFAAQLEARFTPTEPAGVDFASPELPATAQTWRDDDAGPLYLALLRERALFDRAHDRADSPVSTAYALFEEPRDRPEAPAGTQWADQLADGDSIMLTVDDADTLFEIARPRLASNGLVSLTLDDGEHIRLARNTLIRRDVAQPVTDDAGNLYADRQAGWAVQDGWLEFDVMDIDSGIAGELGIPSPPPAGARIRGRLTAHDEAAGTMQLAHLRLITASQRRYALADQITVAIPDTVIRLRDAAAAQEQSWDPATDAGSEGTEADRPATQAATISEAEAEGPAAARSQPPRVAPSSRPRATHGQDEQQALTQPPQVGEAASASEHPDGAGRSPQQDLKEPSSSRGEPEERYPESAPPAAGLSQAPSEVAETRPAAAPPARHGDSTSMAVVETPPHSDDSVQPFETTSSDHAHGGDDQASTSPPAGTQADAHPNLTDSNPEGRPPTEPPSPGGNSAGDPLGARAQLLADEAAVATTAAEVRQRWLQARDEAIPADTLVNAPGGPAPLKAYLDIRGKELLRHEAAAQGHGASSQPDSEAPTGLTPPEVLPRAEPPARPPHGDARPALLQVRDQAYQAPQEAGRRLLEDLHSALSVEPGRPAREPTLYGHLRGQPLYLLVHDPAPSTQAEVSIGHRTVYLGLSQSGEDRCTAYLHPTELAGLDPEDLFQAVLQWASAGEPELTPLIELVTPQPTGDHESASPHAAYDKVPLPAEAPTPPVASPAADTYPSSPADDIREEAGPPMTATMPQAGPGQAAPETAHGEPLAEREPLYVPEQPDAPATPPDTQPLGQAAAHGDLARDEVEAADTPAKRLHRLAQRAVDGTGLAPDLVGVHQDSHQFVVTHATTGDDTLDDEVTRLIRTAVKNEVVSGKDPELARHAVVIRVTQQQGQATLQDTAEPAAPDAAGPDSGRLYELLEEAAALFADELLSSNQEAKKAANYLARRRGHDPHGEVVSRWQVGHARRSRHATVPDHLRTRGYTDEELVRAGLLRLNPDNGSLNNAFFDRLLWPARDLKGRVIGFVGRTLSDAKPKYYNTATETPYGPTLYKKSRVLLGMDRLRSTVGPVYLGEGPPELMAIDAAHEVAGRPWPAAVSSCGTALTTEHVDILRKHSSADRPLIWVLNSDTNHAADKALLRTWHLVADLPGSVLVVKPERANDLGELHEDTARGPREVLRQLENNRQPLLDAVIEADLSLNWDPDIENTQERNAAAARIVANRIWDYLEIAHERYPERDELENLALTHARRIAQPPWGIPPEVTLAEILLDPSKKTADDPRRETVRQRAEQLAASTSQVSRPEPQLSGGAVSSPSPVEEQPQPSTLDAPAPEADGTFAERIPDTYFRPDDLTRLSRVAATQYAAIPNAAADATASLNLGDQNGGAVADYWAERHPLAQYDVNTTHALGNLAANSRQQEKRALVAEAASRMRELIEETIPEARARFDEMIEQTPPASHNVTESDQAWAAARQLAQAAAGALIRDLTRRLAQVIGTTMDRATAARMGAGGIRHALHQIVGWDGSFFSADGSAEQVAHFTAAMQPIHAIARAALRETAVRLDREVPDTESWPQLLDGLQPAATHAHQTAPAANSLSTAAASSTAEQPPTASDPGPEANSGAIAESPPAAHPGAAAELPPGFTLDLPGFGESRYTTDSRAVASVRLSEQLIAFLDAHRMAKRADASDPAPYGHLRAIPFAASAEDLDTDDPVLALWIGDPPTTPVRLPRSELARLHGSRLLAALEWHTVTAGQTSPALSPEWFAELDRILPDDHLDTTITKTEFVELLRAYADLGSRAELTERHRARATEAVALFARQRPAEAMIHLAEDGHRWIRLGAQGWTHQLSPLAAPAAAAVDSDSSRTMEDLQQEITELQAEARALNEDADNAAAASEAAEAAQEAHALAVQTHAVPQTPPAPAGAPPGDEELTAGYEALREILEQVKPHQQALPPGLYANLGDIVTRIAALLPKVRRMHDTVGQPLMGRGRRIIVRTAEILSTIADRLHLPDAIGRSLERFIASLRGAPLPGTPTQEDQLPSPYGDRRLQDLSHNQRVIEQRLADPRLPDNERAALQRGWLVNRAQWFDHYEKKHGSIPGELVPAESRLVAGAPAIPNIAKAHEDLIRSLRERAKQRRESDENDPRADLFARAAVAYEDRLAGRPAERTYPAGLITADVLRTAAVAVARQSSASPLVIQVAFDHQMPYDLANHTLQLLEARGIVGPLTGRAPRTVNVRAEAEIDRRLNNPTAPSPASPPVAVQPASAPPADSLVDDPIERDLKERSAALSQAARAQAARAQAVQRQSGARRSTHPTAPIPASKDRRTAEAQRAVVSQPVPAGQSYG